MIDVLCVLWGGVHAVQYVFEWLVAVNLRRVKKKSPGVNVYDTGHVVVLAGDGVTGVQNVWC